MFRFAQFATGRIRRGGHDNAIQKMRCSNVNDTLPKRSSGYRLAIAVDLGEGYFIT